MKNLPLLKLNRRNGEPEKRRTDTPSRRLAVSLFALLLLAGCTSISYTRTEPGGEKVSFSTSSFITRKAIRDLEYSLGPNETRKFILKGYGNNQTEAIREAIAAALEAYSNRPTPPANPK